jgi:hypothetical protein
MLMGLLLTGFVLVDLGLAATSISRGLLFGTVPMTAFLLYQFAGMRRGFGAIGPGWLLARTEPFGNGLWATFDEIRTVDVKFGSGGSYLSLTTHKRRHFRFPLADACDVTPMLRQLARQALASSASITPEARGRLRGYTVDAGTTADPLAVNTSRPRRDRD